jgi:hypothetical protein
MAGTVTVTRTERASRVSEIVHVVQIDWVADAADGSVPQTTIADLYGFVVKAITNPGAVAPTANYDIEMLEGDDTTVDAMGQTLMNRHTANTEVVYPAVSGAQTPPFLWGSYDFRLTNNAVNSATGRLLLYLKEQL